MKKVVFTILFVVGALFILTTSVVSAGGDQVRGEKGQGTVNHVQVQDPPPFR